MTVSLGLEPFDLLKRLVAAPSPNPPGDETAVAHVINQAAGELGLPPPRVLRRLDHRPNLFLTLGHGDPILILAAHMDTVPTGELSAWNGDPYVLRRQGERLVGLGVADMKAAIAAMLIGGASWLADHAGQGTVLLLFVADEENGSHFGARWLAETGAIAGDAAVLFEPASFGSKSWEEFYVAQRGSCLVWLTARGEPGHSAAPIPRTRRSSVAFVKSLAKLVDADLFKGFRHPVDGTAPTMNVATVVDGGTVPFAYPATLRAAIDVRTIEGMTQEDVLGSIRAVLREAELEDQVSVEVASGATGWIDPGTTVSDQRLLAAARTAWAKSVGSVPAPTVFLATTDASSLHRAGIPTLPAFGPGSLARAHRPNESIALKDLGRATNLVTALAKSYFADAR